MASLYEEAFLINSLHEWYALRQQSMLGPVGPSQTCWVGSPLQDVDVGVKYVTTIDIAAWVFVSYYAHKAF